MEEKMRENRKREGGGGESWRMVEHKDPTEKMVKGKYAVEVKKNERGIELSSRPRLPVKREPRTNSVDLSSLFVRMEVFPVFVVLALAAAGSCTANPHFLDVNIDNVRKMVLEYDPEVRAHEVFQPEREQSPSPPSHSFAVRQFHENILKAESESADADRIPEVAAKLGLDKLVSAVVDAGLKETLESEGPFTVFGPSNEAFDNLPEWAKKEIANVTILAEILKFHVLSGKVESKSLTNDLQVATEDGQNLRINLYDVDKKRVATAQCAPIDLSRVDQAASNGVIHVVDAVLIPPYGDINATVAACPVFETLETAIQVAGLHKILSGPGPYTLFAPTDNAFAKLPESQLKDLLENPTKLAEVLKYHVVSGTFCSSGLTSGNVKTLHGQEVAIKVSSDGVVVNESKVISADGSVTNGVVHAIDTVLLPPGYVLP
ncbi:fasciclin domain containing protein [Elysia marginata]|uniref:Fasciclin domain containing protein n=1 Tax=Elysia marginata TaxID=1093978 RepID=A0AAV4H3F8_9GAST|nr:fasciclin domain containing protein [Elysia marginata]